MNRRKRTSKFLVLAAMLAFLAGGGETLSAQEYPKQQLRFATFLAPTATPAVIAQWWAKEIERRSGGNITVQFFWSGTLAKGNEIIELVGSGGVPLGQTAPSYYPTKLPLSAMPNNLPMVFPDNKTAVLTAAALATDPAVIEENKKLGVRMLFYHSLSTYHVLCTKPVKTVDDFKGLKIRSYGEFIPKMWSTLGAVAVNVSPPEMYEGLKRGNLDCGFWPADFFASYKLYEAAKYLSTANFGAVAGPVVYVSEKQWQAWPQHVRALFEQVSKEAMQRDIQAVTEADKAARETMKQQVQTVQFTQQAELEKRVPDFLGLWVESMAARELGEPAKRLAGTVRASPAK